MDTGATKTVIGDNTLWKEISKIPRYLRSEIMTEEKSKSYYAFGDHKERKAIKRVLLNVTLGTTKCQLAMDVVEGTVPLLISLEALKQMEAIIDLKKSELTLFGKRTKRVKMTRH